MNLNRPNRESLAYGKQMSDITLPIKTKGSNGFVVQVDLRLYEKAAITASVYRYTNKFYVHQQVNSANENLVDVTFETKTAEEPLTDTIIKSFCNDLIDQQLRQNINSQFGHIRDLIVEEAFKPINK